VVVAAQALDKINLEQVLFIPAAEPPHKKMVGASYEDRVTMLELALAARSEPFEISQLEAERPEPSYTVATLLELKKRLGEQHFFFIIGADSLLELHLWYRYKELPGLTDFIVAARPGISLHDVQYAVSRLPGAFIADNSGLCWQRLDGAAIHYLPAVSRNISSSAVRQMVRQGKEPTDINRQVMHYITAHRLYRSSDAGA
jgi:nicotinate-nucleotide adenylyltransferase